MKLVYGILALIALPILTFICLGLLKEIWFLILYKKEYIECLELIRNPPKNIEDIWSFNRFHMHYYVSPDFNLLADGGKLIQADYTYSIQSKPLTIGRYFGLS